MKAYIYILLILFLLSSYTIEAKSSSQISGIIMSSIDKEKITGASVYINGTTKRCITDKNGYFILKGVVLPCDIIVSCIGFESKEIPLLSIEDNLIITLNERNVDLDKVTISGISKRKQNLKYFIKYFLGDDSWADKATITNDSCLYFWHQKDSIIRQPNKEDSILLRYGATLGKGYSWTKDKSLIKQEIDNFHTCSKGPICVELPRLGYNIDVILKEFVLEEINNKKIRKYQLFSYFTERPAKSEHELHVIEENRKKVYLNSSRHFLISLFNNTLYNNGFLLSYDLWSNKFTPIQNWKYVNIDTFIVRNDNKISIIGLKNKTLISSYFSSKNKTPIDLNLFKDSNDKLNPPFQYIFNRDRSTITFLSDTCIILGNGTNPDNTICFGGSMGSHAFATTLPNDYVPILKTDLRIQQAQLENKQNNINIRTSENKSSNRYSFKKIFGNLDSLSNRLQQEKVYLHFDNTEYFQGETIWFKAYVVRADRNSLSSLSKTLYTELVTPEGNIVETNKIKIENGQCHGQFQLKDSLNSGFYEIRAYTRYMLNQDKEYLFSRVFPVYEKPQKAGAYGVRKIHERYYSQRVPGSRKEYEQKGALQLSFYPEGGNLVTGLQSKVAFKAAGKAGENALVTGEILDAKGIKVADLETTYQGMGAFYFTPQIGKYTAKVLYNNRDYNFDLPNIVSNGYVLNIDESNNENINISIQKSAQLPNDTLGIAICCRGVLYASDYATFNNGNTSTLLLPRRILPSGVSLITLFNKNGNPLCERMVFVNHNSQMKMVVEQDKNNYNPFEKINLDFELSDARNNPIETTFSLAVRDASSSTYNPYRDNILSNLLLSSELRGYIENPGYYFESDTHGRKSALDLLMLTQGWSRYVWNEMTGLTAYKVKHPIEKSLVLEGHVLSLYKKKPKANVEVWMFMPLSDSTSLRGTYLTDEAGRFNFALTDFNGNAKLSLQTKEKEKRSENNIILDRMFSPEFKVYAYKEKQLPENVFIRKDSVLLKRDTLKPYQYDLVNNLDILSKQSMEKKQHLLKEVEVKKKKKFKREGEGLNNASNVYDVEKVVDDIIDKGIDEPNTALDFIKSINKHFNYQIDQVIPAGGKGTEEGIRVYYKGKPTILLINNRSIANIDNEGKLYNIVDPSNNIKNLYTNQIETISVIEKSGNSIKYLPTNATGEEVVIYIYTYKDMHIRNNEYGIRQTYFNGYSSQREFYNPIYQNVSLPLGQDHRRTLYWNPDVRTDKDGKARVIFYKNNSDKSIAIDAQTVTENGMIGVCIK